MVAEGSLVQSAVGERLLPGVNDSHGVDVRGAARGMVVYAHPEVVAQVRADEAERVNAFRLERARREALADLAAAHPEEFEQHLAKHYTPVSVQA
jgi:hypothetical protein